MRPTESCLEGDAEEASGKCVLLRSVRKGTQKKQVVDASYGELSGRGRRKSKWGVRPTESCLEGDAEEAIGECVLLKAVREGTRKKQLESASYGELSGRVRRRSKCRSASYRELTEKGRIQRKIWMRPKFDKNRKLLKCGIPFPAA